MYFKKLYSMLFLYLPKCSYSLHFYFQFFTSLQLLQLIRGSLSVCLEDALLRNCPEDILLQISSIVANKMCSINIQDVLIRPILNMQKIGRVI